MTKPIITVLFEGEEILCTHVTLEYLDHPNAWPILPLRLRGKIRATFHVLMDEDTVPKFTCDAVNALAFERGDHFVFNRQAPNLN